MGTAVKFRKTKKNSSSLVYVLHKTYNQLLRHFQRRRNRALTAKKCTKKRDARAKVVVFLNKPIAFRTFSLPLPSPSPSSLLNLPIKIFNNDSKDELCASGLLRSG